MKSIIKFFPIAAILYMGMLSCDEKESLKEDEKQSGPNIETLSAYKVTFMVATLSGRVSGLEGAALDFECGIEYSTDESFSDEYSTRQKIDKKYTEDSYSITVSGIQPGKKYYYRSYCINQLLIYYGDVKTFTFEWTAPAVTTLSAELNETGAVVLKGLVKDKGALVNDLILYYPYGYYYGIEYSTTDTFEDNSTTSLYPDRNTDSMENDSVICVLTQINNGTTYYYQTFFRLGGISNYGEVKTFKFEREEPKMVDLGLSVKWATFNVGATAPEEYGDYFAWGETEPYYEAGYSQESPQAHWKDGKYSGYTWFTYKFCNGSYDALTKYCYDSSYGNNGFTDTKATLDLEDDVAHVKWGADWRMPTRSEMAELCNGYNCTWTWTTQNGVNGYLVTSKKSGFEGASIFLPAAGSRDYINLYGDGRVGQYWSSSLNTGRPDYAWFLGFSSGSLDADFATYVSRCSGQSVRPVCP